MKTFRFTFAFILVAIAAAAIIIPVQAADAIYPPGMRVGLVPMQGLTLATDFSGFESADKNVKVGVTEIPEAAFTAIDTAVKQGNIPAGAPKPELFETAIRKGYFTIENGKDGIFNVRNFSLILPSEKFSGYVIVQLRDGADKSFSEEAIRKMLATTVIRTEVPVDEQLGLLAFKMSDLADFKTVRTIAPRSAVLLTDDTDGAAKNTSPYMMIGVLQSATVEPGDRARFAQQVATAIPGLRDARITSSEPIRIDGTAGFETRIDATGANDTPISVVQWLRFANGGTTLRVVGVVSRDEWPKAFPRFRAVRDGIGPR